MTIRARIQKPWLLSLVTWSDSERRQTRIPASLNKCLERGTTEILKNLKIMFLKDGVVFLTRWLMAPGQQPCLSYLQTFPSWSGTSCTGQMSCEGVFMAGLKVHHTPAISAVVSSSWVPTLRMGGMCFPTDCTQCASFSPLPSTSVSFRRRGTLLTLLFRIKTNKQAEVRGPAIPNSSEVAHLPLLLEDSRQLALGWRNRNDRPDLQGED